jgi:hypothetical protein
MPRHFERLFRGRASIGSLADDRVEPRVTDARLPGRTGRGSEPARDAIF